ncbi:13623_t:CDS:2, partial [Racocetra persica]
LNGISSQSQLQLISVSASTFIVYTCNSTKQFEVKTIAKNIKGTARRHKFKVPEKLGPPGDFYFLKYTDSRHRSYVDFSGFFTINGTKGTIPGFDPPKILPTTTYPATTTTYSATISEQTPDNTGDVNNGPLSSPTNSIISPTPISSGSSKQYQVSMFEEISLGVITFVFIVISNNLMNFLNI